MRHATKNSRRLSRSGGSPRRQRETQDEIATAPSAVAAARGDSALPHTGHARQHLVADDEHLVEGVVLDD